MKTIMENLDEWFAQLSSQNVFRFLEPSEQKDLFARGAVIQFEQEELIVSEGDLSPSFFVVIQGTVKVHVKQDEQQVYICSLGDGTSFGEASLFSHMLRTASVSALDDVVIFKLTRFDIMTFINVHPRAGNRVLLVFINGLMKKLREANRELAYERRGDSGQLDVDALISELANAGNA
jgi:CRP-like cAMP-binding protein